MTLRAIGISRMAGRLGRLCPAQVRQTRFGWTRIGRRGLVEQQVYAFMRRVADELTARDLAEAALRDENARLKNALRTWQSQQAARLNSNNNRRWTDSEQHR